MGKIDFFHFKKKALKLQWTTEPNLPNTVSTAASVYSPFCPNSAEFFACVSPAF